LTGALCGKSQSGTLVVGSASLAAPQPNSASDSATSRAPLTNPAKRFGGIKLSIVQRT